MIKDINLQNVNILLMEGTMLQRSNKNFQDEQSYIRIPNRYLQLSLNLFS